MSRLRIFAETQPGRAHFVSEDPAEIGARLRSAGIRFERWPVNPAIAAGADSNTVLATYRNEIDRLVSAEHYQTHDVVSMHAAHPDKTAMRQKFLDEHTHSEDEVRFFVAGCGLFTLHVDDQVYEVLCREGDLISVPAKTRHWFDMGPNPSFVAIRFFNNPEGWVAKYTRNDIASRFPRFE